MALGILTGSGRRSRRQKDRSRPDYVLALAVAGLVLIGLIMVYSATFDWCYQAFDSSFHMVKRQLLWIGIGTVGLVLAAALPYDLWRRAAVPLMAGMLLLLVLVLFVGDDLFGARRSFLNGSIQPGEMAKLAVVIYVAAWLASKGDQVRNVAYGLLPFALLVGVVVGLIVLQPDLSMAILIGLTASSMLFFSGADLFQLAAGGAASAVTIAVLIDQMPHAKQRIIEYREVLQRLWSDPTLLDSEIRQSLVSLNHIHQSLISLGSGGFLGTGIGRGLHKLGYLPAPHTDSIFSVIGEEAGFVGCILVLGLFALITYRGVKITLAAPDAFSAILACGITCWLTWQALINAAVMTGLFPFTGIALPFVSFGGSAMGVSLTGVGLLLGVSRGKQIEKRVRKGRVRSANLDRRWGNRGARLSRSRRRRSARRRFRA